MRIIWFLVLNFCIQVVSAEVIDIEANTFGEIQARYQEEALNPRKTLFVFDMDDTLLSMSQPLGGVAWWDWQSHLLAHNPSSEQLVAHNFQDLLKVQNILFSIIKMNVTDEQVIPFLKEISLKNVSLMVLTARGSDFLNVSLAQLEENGFIDEQQELLFNKKKIKLKHSVYGYDGVLNCPQFTRQVTYYQGIVFLDGEDKGQALRCMLDNGQNKYNTVVYVDDSVANITSVRKAFIEDASIRVLNVLYTHEHQKEEIFRDSPALQSEADRQWRSIMATVEGNVSHSRLAGIASVQR